MLKLFDKVKYTSGRFGDNYNNPLWNGKSGKIIGKIVNIDNDTNIWCKVKWNNNEYNDYRLNDLEKVSEHKDLFGREI
jgi:hypothetical protein